MRAALLLVLPVFLALPACGNDDSDGAGGSDASVTDGAATDAARSADGATVDGSVVEPAALNLASYSHACAQDSDCVLVTPLPCNPSNRCACPDDAISESADTQFSADETAYVNACNAAYSGISHQGCGIECAEVAAACCAGTCAAVPGAPGSAICPQGNGGNGGNGGADAATDAAADAASDGGADAD